MVWATTPDESGVFGYLSRLRVADGIPSKCRLAVSASGCSLSLSVSRLTRIVVVASWKLAVQRAGFSFVSIYIYVHTISPLCLSPARCWVFASDALARRHVQRYACNERSSSFSQSITYQITCQRPVGGRSMQLRRPGSLSTSTETHASLSVGRFWKERQEARSLTRTLVHTG